MNEYYIMITHNMMNDIRKFLIMRGKPSSYAEHEKFVKEYEKSQLAQSNPVKLEHPVLLAEIETQKLHTEELSDLIQAMTKNDQDDEQQFEYRKRNRECYHCGMRGHIAAYCYASGGSAFPQI
jgi:hypothetical protein